MNYSDLKFIETERKYLEAMIAFKDDFEKIEKLDVYGWPDWDEENPIVTLDRKSVISILKRFLNDELSAMNLYRWGWALAERDTLGYEYGYASPLKEVVYGLGTEFHPRLGLVTKDVVRKYLTAIENKEFEEGDD